MSEPFDLQRAMAEQRAQAEKFMRDLNDISQADEIGMWFAPAGTEPKDIVSFHRSNDFEHVGAEVRATRERVGVTEIANFAKYEVTGAGAEAFLNRLMTNRMPKPGRIVLNESVPQWVRKELMLRGYRPELKQRTSGPINAIMLDHAHGSLWGGSSNFGEDYGVAW